MTSGRIADGGWQIADGTVTAGRMRWTISSDKRDLLLGAGGLRLDEWLAAGRASVVKHGPHRTVYRVVLPELDFFVKHYRVAGALAWLRESVRPSKARREYEQGLAVARRGIPTVKPLGFGEAQGVFPGESFVLTHTLPDTEPLGAFLEQTLPTFETLQQVRLRQRLAATLGQFIAGLHNAGIVHHDLHPNNLLVRLEGADFSLFLIDLHAVRLGGPLGWRAGRDNLVILNRWFVLRADRADRLRFWEAYYQARLPFGDERTADALRAESRERARDVEERTWRSNLGFWRQRDRRCLGDNRTYRRVRSATVAGHAVADLDRTTLDGLLADPDEPFRRPAVVLLKDSRSSTVAEFDAVVNGVVRRVVYKRFRVTSPGDPWLALVRRTPALRSWVQGHGLRDRWLPTPRPLLVLHRRRFGRPQEGYLLTEKVADAVELGRFVASLASLPAPERQGQMRRLVEGVARLVRELHRRRLSHRDLKAANILVQRTASEAPSVWLIDLVGARRHRRLSDIRRVRDLTRLHASFCRSSLVTLTDKLRFLRVYLEWGLRGKQGWKGWWRAIAEATRAKVKRNARRGRPLA